jgi:phosphatidate cytidylyltransferase
VRVRLLWTIAVLAPFVALVWADFNHNLGVPCLWLFFLALLVALLATMELRPLLAPIDLLPTSFDCLLGVTLVIATSGVPVFWPLFFHQPYPEDCPVGRLGCTLLGLVLAMGVALLQQMGRYRQPRGNAIIKAALVTFTAAYLGVCVSLLLCLRTFHSNEWGMVALVSTIAVVKLADAGAYLAGRSFGRRPLAPLLSPKKTVEGAAGAIIAAIASSLVCRWLLVPQMVPKTNLQADSWLNWLILGVLLGIAGILGDLAESLIKRDAGQKDSSRWLPGLGGMLDLLDSILSAAPVAYVAWSMGLIGPK